MSAKTYAWAALLINSELRGGADPCPASVYLALFTTATDQDGNGTESTGGGYARKAVTFANPAGTNVTSNSAAVTFSNMPASTVGWAALFTASSGGKMMYQGALAVSKTFYGGETFVFDVGTIALQFD